MTGNANKLAVVTLSRPGLLLGERLRRELRHAEVYCPRPCGERSGRAHTFDGRLGDFLPRLLVEHDQIVCVMALGIVVRLIGPLARDKSRDPAVVVVDEAGRFAISVLSGHRGGANELAWRVAEILGATPVITTANDVLGLPAVDLIGQEFGWKIENAENLTAVATAVVNGRPVAVFQDAGERDWLQPFGPWPKHFERVSDVAEIDDRFAANFVTLENLAASVVAIDS